MCNYKNTERFLTYRETKISSAIEILGQARTDQKDSWSILVSFSDPEGNKKTLLIPRGDLFGDAKDVLKRLSSEGMLIFNWSLVKQYLMSSTVLNIYTIIKETGWNKDIFVLPNQIIGNNLDLIYFDSTCIKNDYNSKGTLEEWKEQIGQYCNGNDRLILAISLALAGPLLNLLGIENGGIHFTGKSSSGKSTIARVASSVWGDSNFMRTWRITDSAMDYLASSRNDTFLVMDELNQVDPAKAGNMIYLLGNGEGKGRAKSSGGLRDSKKWRLLVLSTGEKGFAECAQESKGRYKAGQEVRMAELPAIGEGYSHGCFQNIHDFEGGRELAEHLNTAVKKYYGTPSIAFINALINTPIETIRTSFDKIYFRMLEGLYQADGQVSRVARRFALIATAGVLGIDFNILPWNAEETIKAVKRCLDEWIVSRGGLGSHEETALLEQVKLFMEQHSERRFSKIRTSYQLFKGLEDVDGNISEEAESISEDDMVPVHTSMAGYCRTVEDKTEYLIYPTVFKEEICKGFSEPFAKEVLFNNGWLKQKQSKNERPVKGGASKKFYIMTDRFWDYAFEPVSAVSLVSEFQE